MQIKKKKNISANEPFSLGMMAGLKMNYLRPCTKKTGRACGSDPELWFVPAKGCATSSNATKDDETAVSPCVLGYQ